MYVHMNYMHAYIALPLLMNTISDKGAQPYIDECILVKQTMIYMLWLVASFYNSNICVCCSRSTVFEMF